MAKAARQTILDVLLANLLMRSCERKVTTARRKNRYRSWLTNDAPVFVVCAASDSKQLAKAHTRTALENWRESLCHQPKHAGNRRMLLLQAPSREGDWAGRTFNGLNTSSRTVRIARDGHSAAPLLACRTRKTFIAEEQPSSTRRPRSKRTGLSPGSDPCGRDGRAWATSIRAKPKYAGRVLKRHGACARIPILRCFSRESGLKRERAA